MQRITAAALLFAPLLGSCAGPHVRTISLRTLEQARYVIAPDVVRTVITDPTAVSDLIRPLNPEMSLLVVRNDADWQRLANVTPGIGKPPDLASGIACGLIYRGRPLNNQWPLWVRRVRIHEGAGMLEAGYIGGTVFPDDIAMLELAWIQGLRSVLVVEVDDIRFFPDTRRVAARQRHPITTLPI